MTCEYCGHTLERRDGCYRCPTCGAVDSAGDERDDWDEQHDGEIMQHDSAILRDGQ